MIDLTGPICENMWSYGPPFSQFQRTRISELTSHGYIAYNYSIASHMGTHIDSGAHFDEKAPCIDDIPLELLYGSALIINIPNCPVRHEIKLEDVSLYENKVLENDIVLISTGWDKMWENSRYVADTPFISNDLADFLISKKIKLIGTDTALCCDPRKGLSLVSNDSNIPDMLFLNNGIPYINGLVNLNKIQKERITFLALPLKIAFAEGTPVRAIALD